MTDTVAGAQVEAGEPHRDAMMAAAGARAETWAGPAGDVRPYAPSWVNRLIRAIDRLPGPAWPWYLVACLVSIPFSNAQAWLAGLQPQGELSVPMSY